MTKPIPFPTEREREDPAQSAFRTLQKTIRLSEAPPKKGVAVTLPPDGGDGTRTRTLPDRYSERSSN